MAMIQHHDFFSFAEYMDLCMFDPDAGYYASGRVSFGATGDFWTYPMRLSPWFGHMLGMRIMEFWTEAEPHLDPNQPFHLVEIGGGKGQWMVDLIAYLQERAQTDQAAARLLKQSRFVAADRSPTLSKLQSQVQGNRVEHLCLPAHEIAAHLPSPFQGFIFSNELFDVLPTEVLRISPQSTEQLFLALEVSSPLHPLAREQETSWRPIPLQNLPALIQTLKQDEALARAFASRDIARWHTRWLPTEAHREYTHQFAAPLLKDFEALDLLPAQVAYPPMIQPISSSIGQVLASPGSVGAFLAIDYGGTARHLFDSNTQDPHLRTYPPLGALQCGEAHDLYRSPGFEDITADVDFTWIASCLEKAGAEISFYGHQGALETGMDLWEAPSKNALLAKLLREENGDFLEAARRAWQLVLDFRFGPGFRALLATSPGFAKAGQALGESEPWRHSDEIHIPRNLDRENLSRSLLQALQGEKNASDIVQKTLSAIHPGGSLRDDLGDHSVYAWRKTIEHALRSFLAHKKST